jgi:hypothetical protein
MRITGTMGVKQCNQTRLIIDTNRHEVTSILDVRSPGSSSYPGQRSTVLRTIRFCPVHNLYLDIRFLVDALGSRNKVYLGEGILSVIGKFNFSYRRLHFWKLHVSNVISLGEQHRKQKKMMNPVFSIKHMRGMSATTFYSNETKLIHIPLQFQCSTK